MFSMVQRFFFCLFLVFLIWPSSVEVQQLLILIYSIMMFAVELVE